MPKLLAALLLLLGAFSVAHAESNPQWVQVQSDHFTVITDSSDKQARHIDGQFERMRSIFSTLFPARVADSGPRIIVFAFKDRKGFNALEPAAYLAKGSLQLAGLFLRTPDKNYILVRLDTEGEHPYSIVYHEYTHFLMRKSEWIPLWLNEGLAEFYQNTEIEGKDVRLGEPSPDDILYLRDHPLLPLTTLLAVDHNSPYYHEENKGSVFYAESWALTHYIQLNDFTHKTQHLQDYAKLLQQHQDPVTAAQHAFGDLGQLQKALTEYIGQRSFQLFTMKGTYTVDEASFKSVPISASDVDAIRADVLVGDDRTGDASALLDKVLGEDPKNTLARESQGFLCMRKQDMECACKWFTEAVKLGSQSAMANYYFAVMSLQTGVKGSDDAIEASLLTAIKLEPNFAPSYDTLAHFYAIHNEKFDEAHALFAHAIELEPQQLNYRLNASSLEMQRNQYDNAVRILEAAAALATKPDQIQMLQSRIAQIKNFQTQREKSDSAALSTDVPTSAVTTSATNAVTADGKTFTVSAAASETPEKTWPVAEASAKHHIVTGTLREVKCAYPTTLTLKLDQGAKSVPLFSANYYKVEYGAANFTPPDNLNPCTAIEGMKARIEYADVTDSDVTGQIVSIILSK
jgi:tetratricopeptide (TPR) repeat protein